MKIVLYNDFEIIVGGTEVYQKALSKSLREKGHDVLEIFGTRSAFPKTTFAFKKILLFNSLKLNKELRERILKDVNRFSPDVIYINNNKIFTKTVLKTFNRGGYSVISAFHDFHFLYKGFGVFSFKRWWKRALFKLVDKNSDALCSLTRIIKSELEVHSERPIFYLPLFVDEAIWKYKADCHLNSPSIVFFGRMEEAKGIFFLWEAYKLVVGEVKNCKLLFIGEGTDSDKMKVLAQHSSFREKVIFRPRLQQEELLEALHQTRVAVVPTISAEPFGMTGIEAQSAGLPVVASRVGGIPEWCVDGETGLLVAAGNIRELADALIKVLSDQKLSQQLSEKAKANCVQQFGKDIIIEKTEKMLVEVAGKK